MLKHSLYSVVEAPSTECYILVPNQGRIYMNFLGEIGKLLSRFSCLGILKRRFQCQKSKQISSWCSEHLCVVASHKTHHRQMACHGPYSFFNVSSVPASLYRGKRASWLQFDALFFGFVQGWEFFQPIHAHARGNVPRESKEEHQKSYLLL